MLWLPPPLPLQRLPLGHRGQELRREQFRARRVGASATACLSGLWAAAEGLVLEIPIVSLLIPQLLQGRRHGAGLWRHRCKHGPGTGRRRIERHCSCRSCGRGCFLQRAAVPRHNPAYRQCVVLESSRSSKAVLESSRFSSCIHSVFSPPFAQRGSSPSVAVTGCPS